MSFILLQPVTLYLLKVTLLSAFLCGYYCLFLRNAAFHPYNRFYLLSATAASLVLPLLPLPAAWPGAATILLPAGPIMSGPLLPGPAQPHSTVDAFGNWHLAGILYIIIAVLFLLRLAPSLLYITRLTRKYPPVRMKDIRFYATDEPGTPFSFGARLFWNDRIPLDSAAGQAILQHEMSHIRQRHTLDILPLETLRCLFWINPIFHWTLREIRVIHEFLADRDALASGGDPCQYAECLVWQSATPNATGITHSFFHTHLKRRITMIIKTKPGRPRYLSRALALPLLLLLATTIATHATPQTTGSPYLPFLRFFNHHLRYPQSCLDAGFQSIVWVHIHMDEQGRMTSLTSCDAATFTEHKGKAIRVTSRPIPGKAVQPTSPDFGNPFLEAVEKTTASLGKDKSETYPAGDFYFSFTFNIEKP